MDQAASLERLRRFLDAVRVVEDTGALRDMIQETVSVFGVRYYSLVRHTRMLRAKDPYVGLSTYPEDWIELVRSRGYFSDDPILSACDQAAVGFDWSERIRSPLLSRRQAEYLSLAAERGLNRGFTVPLHVPGEPPASCSFVVGDCTSFDGQFRAMAQWVSASAFERLRRMTPTEAPPARLSDRQIECLTWLARGKSRPVTAQILGISEDTVRMHVKAVKAKWNVSSTVQVIVRALSDGIISYRDVLH